jgi:hypothetical protein
MFHDEQNKIKKRRRKKKNSKEMLLPMDILNDWRKLLLLKEERFSL